MRSPDTHCRHGLWGDLGKGLTQPPLTTGRKTLPCKSGGSGQAGGQDSSSFDQLVPEKAGNTSIRLSDVRRVFGEPASTEDQLDAAIRDF